MPTSIANLSFDPLNEIFRYIDLQDLINCTEVTPMFEEAAYYQLQRRYKSFTINEKSIKFKTIAELMNAFNYIGPFVKTLTYGGLRSPKMYLYDLIDIIRMCPVLETLKITTQTVTEPVRLPNLYNLRSFHISYASINEKLLQIWLSSCSDNLRSIFFQGISMTGTCLASAPISVRSLSIIWAMKNNNLDHIVNYIKRNPNLTELDMKYMFPLDIANFSNYLLKMERLTLYCTELMNFSALAKLIKLTSLNLVVRSNTFADYPESITNGSSCLTELEMEIFDIDITCEMARSFEKFSKLKTLKLFLNKSVTNHNRLLPHLGRLSELQDVEFNGLPFDLHSVCKHLTQIKILHISVDAEYNNPSGLVRMTKLEYIRMCTRPLVIENERDSEQTVTQTVNNFMIAVAQSDSIRYLGLQALASVKLHANTISALNASKLLHVDLFGVFYGDDTIKLVRNLIHLKILRQHFPTTEEENLALLQSVPRDREVKIIMNAGSSYLDRKHTPY